MSQSRFELPTSRLSSEYSTVELQAQSFLIGIAGFEPALDGSKIHYLTTWLYSICA
jgi:hypothetical protein